MRSPDGAELPERQRAKWMAHKPAALDLAECCWTEFDVMLLMSPCMTCASQRPAAHSDSRVGCGPPRAAWRRMTSRTMPESMRANCAMRITTFLK